VPPEPGELLWLREIVAAYHQWLAPVGQGPSWGCGFPHNPSVEKIVLSGVNENRLLR